MTVGLPQTGAPCKTSPGGASAQNQMKELVDDMESAKSIVLKVTVRTLRCHGLKSCIAQKGTGVRVNGAMYCEILSVNRFPLER